MTHAKLVFASGEELEIDDEWHPLLKSPFIREVLECQDGGEDSNAIPLPAFLEWNSMVAFYNLLYHAAAGDHRTMGFGKHYDLTYSHVMEYHTEYYTWGRQQRNPGDGLQAFLDWAGARRSRLDAEQVTRILPVAKFFQIDMCAQCGVLGPSADICVGSSTRELHPCCRTKWPRVPEIPDWDTVTANAENKRAVWREAWTKVDQERKDNGRVVCCSDDLFCGDCLRQKGCQFCKIYECEACDKDTETPKIFEEWHENDPHAYEDEYGRRGVPPYQALKTSKCLGCGRKACEDCSTECQDCHRRAFERCKVDLNSWCERCRFTIENTQADIGPIDRSEYVCRPCFDRRPHFCGCGEPSYDPDAQDSENESDGINYSDQDEENFQGYEDYENEGYGDFDEYY